ncbi:hypothetical protein HPB51_025577 [Rhipicephalus microplus]|uniref:Uncharacterized protein n=1 Tax=Rhipicephalus microplus TaxID=6941 RepID=A0A9J6DXE4_RHIMP|nr:hypothetical protein HPB51_025577 [Rhipicephalus microplus]
MPQEVEHLFGNVAPSVGHGLRVCKILKAEWYRQARLHKQYLSALLFDRLEDTVAMQQLRQFQRLADQSTEFLWARQLPVLRTGVAKKVTDLKPTVHVPEQITVPPDILRTLSLGPKFAVKPKTSPPELLAMVRQVSRHVPEQEQPHSVSEGVDTVSRYRPAGSKIPLRRVEAFLKEHSLTVLPADKEGGFAILTLGLFGSKAHTAVSSVFSSREDVRIEKVESEAKKLCKDLDLPRVVGGITNIRRTLDSLLLASELPLCFNLRS